MTHPQPLEPLANRLKPVDEALARLRARTDAVNSDELVVLEGLTAVVRELAQQKWTAS